MYDPVADPYCYPGTTILRNIPDLRNSEALGRFEAIATGRRFLEPMPVGRWTVRHYNATHRHIFQDVYSWAGRFRTVRISKGGSVFCYPENIPGQMRSLFAKLKRDDFLRDRDAATFTVEAVHWLATLNAIHPFRDGNGRAQLAFMALLCARAGHRLDFERLDPDVFLAAMVASFDGDEQPLAAQLRSLMA